MARYPRLITPHDIEIRSIPVPETGCWIWLDSVGTDGYGRMPFEGKWRRAARLSFEAFFSKPPDDLNVCHRCDQPLCVNPDHLFLGTQSDNMTDCARKGRINRKNWVRRAREAQSAVLTGLACAAIFTLILQVAP